MENNKKELNDRAMKEVTGGWVTRMRCSECGCERLWDGIFDYEWKTYECPQCKKQTFKGVERIDAPTNHPIF